VGHQFGPNSIEVEDTYLRLDRDLEEMIKTIETQMGKENVLFFLTADHGAALVPGFLKQNKIPSGVFNEKKMLDSLNKFLVNNYKVSNLVSYYTNQQIYLNYPEIEKNNIQIKELQEKAAAFLLQLDGIASVTASVNLKYINSSSGGEKMIKSGYNAKRSGDIILSFKPGWLEGRQKGTTHSESYVYDTHIPLLWYGWKIEQGETSTSVDITDIAPTLSDLLRISFPNGTTGNPIAIPVKK
jgi:predicted AlkP superfamily pyrophosphatase or phosphodiesterase